MPTIADRTDKIQRLQRQIFQRSRQESLTTEQLRLRLTSAKINSERVCVLSADQYPSNALSLNERPRDSDLENVEFIMAH